jgi:hypothetical protein
MNCFSILARTWLSFRLLRTVTILLAVLIEVKTNVGFVGKVGVELAGLVEGVVLGFVRVKVDGVVVVWVTEIPGVVAVAGVTGA